MAAIVKLLPKTEGAREFQFIKAEIGSEEDSKYKRVTVY
jgi:hypothetical protein